uniref:Transferrin receptor protein 1 n=1 Tax=Astyanax mexicanus TaxID=7994 RepID=A0A8B9H3D1_ASTMX
HDPQCSVRTEGTSWKALIILLVAKKRPKYCSEKNTRFVILSHMFSNIIIYMFVSGYLVGYLSHRRTDRAAPSCAEALSSDDSDGSAPIQTVPSLDWKDITALFKDKLTTANIESSLSEFSFADHQAGSAGDEALANKLMRKFRDYNMNPWTDEHFVRVQDPPSSGSNKITFRDQSFSESGFLSYSGTGSVQVLDQLEVYKLFWFLVSLCVQVHLGCGDPYTPGFPSFNNTQFPPAQSSGLPTIPAQTIRPSTAAAIMGMMEGRDPPRGWGNGGLQKYKLGGDDDLVTVEVNNVLTEKKIHNVFGVIKGLVDAGMEYILSLGGARDATTYDDSMKNKIPRRSIVFASWSAGEYGAVGATEWLESLIFEALLNFVIILCLIFCTGSSFKASASPLMYDLIQSTLKEVSSPSDPSRSLYSEVSGRDWEAAVMEPMKLSDAAYPFLAFSGIPSVSIREYPFFDTMLDTRENLINKTSNKFLTLVKTAGEIAGQMTLRLVHDHLIRLNVEKYTSILRSNVALINRDLTGLKYWEIEWLMSALGSFSRAAKKLTTSIEESDLEEVEQCRIINNRIMGVERNFLSPYVCPQVSPFRHILLGSGSHTLGGLRAHLTAIKEGSASADLDLLKNQFALTTWTIQSCANALAGSVWEMDNEI